ncbi:uncharacterized protein LOC120641404 [Panicum virgatum]|uniref:H15 domain-containing protein n=1 Tax=Panicum virgatum TaxID=38727 RepID=A0A8T0QJ82_PANVG|nr:uncharacterized protein LOC120641404 [Panicum virgatum]KAG2573713.1 hypothetical protein PVAP13_7KG274100 [Panicum virgatum]KAG2573714.1 hypothetical protein PVAP13_7KG274100 [Panicum virgatum]
MAAAVEVDAGQAAKRDKEMEEGKTLPPSPPVGAVRKQRQPTPDHPPYCWMIGEAIDELCEDGGSSEDSISAFIRARHPGVPPAHDRLLRHYLKKHVVEGFFVCTAAERYLRSPEEDTDVERPVEQAAAGLSEEVADARKDGALSVIPKRRAAAQEYVPASPVAVANKDGSQAASSLPKRRGRRRAVVGLAAAEDSVPASPVADGEDRSQAVSSTPKRRGLRQTAARLAAAEDSLPTSPAAVADKDGDQAASSTPKRRGRLRRLGMTTATNSSGKALVPGQKDSSEVPYTTGKELALVIMGNGSATTSIMDMACTTEATPTTPMDGGQPLELALVTTTDVPVPVATPAIDNKDGRSAPSLDLALVAKTDDICRASTSPESSSQARELVLVAADDGSVPVLMVADKDGVEEAPYATNKSVCQPRKAGSVPTAGKKDGGKAPSATPKGHRRPCTRAAVATNRSALTPVAGKKAGRKVSFTSPKLIPVTPGGCSVPASVADQDSIQARKLYPVTAEEIPDDPACCLLALPCLTPAAANA